VSSNSFSYFLTLPKSFNVKTYRELITDLIGIRALHLFKDEWRPIHEFITATWDLHEKPIAYYRDGDPEELLNALRKAGCNVTGHQFGYRSIHYIIKSQTDNETQLVELQVRTIFEEGGARSTIASDTLISRRIRSSQTS
jgi:ppGpp synthetase/RelA/SpoT-type nucleotidyltranferase